MESKQMNIFIVGSGKLANTILASDLSFVSCNILKWESEYQNLEEKAILIHAGSGRQLKECIEFCSKTKSVLIELSTGQFVPDREAERRPATTVRETIKVGPTKKRK